MLLRQILPGTHSFAMKTLFLSFYFSCNYKFYWREVSSVAIGQLIVSSLTISSYTNNLDCFCIVSVCSGTCFFSLNNF